MQEKSYKLKVHVESELKELEENLDSEDVDSTSSSSDESSESFHCDRDQRCVIFHTRNLQEGRDETAGC